MTTEVLRNMLYASSPDLRGLTAVVMDEIHYLADKFRGAVWEEVILHLPPEVQVVGLSATVSNAEEFGAWLREVRGETDGGGRRDPAGAAVAAHDGRAPAVRPVRRSVGSAVVDPTTARARANGTEREPPRRSRTAPTRRWPGSTRCCCAAVGSRGDRRPVREPRGRGRFRNGGPRWRPPARVDVIERLDGAGLLPAITFIFSRAGCDAAVAQCVRSGMRLTTETERGRDPGDRRPAHRRTGRPVRRRPGRARLLGVAGGAGTRHRGPPRRAAAGVQGDRRGAVRRRAGQGGLRHRDAGAGHQHAGPHRRAGEAGQVQRRGPRRPDPRGVHPAHRPGRPPRHRHRGPRGGDLVARHGPADRRRAWPPGGPIRCGRSFRPSYNMAVNLVDRLGREAAKDLLEQSFAQFQGDRAVVGMARQVARNDRGHRRTAGPCPVTSATSAEYLGVVNDLSAAEKAAAPAGSAAPARHRRGRPDADSAAVTSSRSRPAGEPGWRWSWTPASAPTASRARWWSPRDTGRAGCPPPTSAGRCLRSAGSGSTSSPTTAGRRCVATSPPALTSSGIIGAASGPRGAGRGGRGHRPGGAARGRAGRIRCTAARIGRRTCSGPGAGSG